MSAFVTGFVRHNFGILNRTGLFVTFTLTLALFALADFRVCSLLLGIPYATFIGYLASAVLPSILWTFVVRHRAKELEIGFLEFIRTEQYRDMLVKESAKYASIGWGKQ